MPQAGLSSVDDDEIGVYADDKDAVLITDDKGLSRLRREGVYGQVVEIRGRKTAACQIVEDHLPEIVERLQRHDEVVITVSAAGAWVTGPRHLAEAPPKADRGDQSTK